VVAGSALISVVAGSVVALVHASNIRMARVVGTRVAVLAFQERPGDAFAVCAVVVGGAHVSVVAGDVQINVQAPFARVARIVRTGVAVVAVGRDTRQAEAVSTLVAHTARIRVVAGKTLVVRLKRALAGDRVARSLLADGSLSDRVRAYYDCVGRNLALVRHHVGIAKEGPGAEVSIFQNCAVLVTQAVAGHLDAEAFPFLAAISQGAWVAVVTIRIVGRVFATAGLGADIVRTRVFIVAVYRIAEADTIHAVVGHRARIPVHTLALRERHVLAPGFAVADVLRAVVFVIAQVHEIAADLHRLVNELIAIVIDAVARLLSRLLRIAIRESFLPADPLARTGPEIVCSLARRPKRQLHGFAGAGADSAVNNALGHDNAVDGLDLLAGESPGTLLCVRAMPAAKCAVGPVAHAHVIRSTNSLAVVSGGARPAQVGEIGHADVHNVRESPRHLPATPPGRAFVLAGQGANTLAHMLDAPGGLALRVLRALVKEAALAGVAAQHDLLGYLVEQELRTGLRDGTVGNGNIRHSDFGHGVGGRHFHPGIRERLDYVLAGLAARGQNE